VIYLPSLPVLLVPLAKKRDYARVFFRVQVEAKL